MCGISGIYRLDNKPEDMTVIRAMLDLIRHRGPDALGVTVFNSGSGEFKDIDGSGGNKAEGKFDLGLGHCRLSIIDLSILAHQPMCNEDGSVWITYNGEIFNYIELAETLKSRGHVFKSHSDTEVIIHAYEEWGMECLNRFNGMWAFAIWDQKKQRLFCARDRFGVKPFYYYFRDDRFIFASEIKSILVHPHIQRVANQRAIYFYLKNNYGFVDINPETFFKDIRKIEPAHYLLADKHGISIKRYWSLKVNINRNISEAEAVSEFRDLLTDSVKLRLRSDVPVGSALSGGLDSSAITCVAVKILKAHGFKVFSSCFEQKKYDERDYAQAVVDENPVDPFFVYPNTGDFENIIKRIIWYQDEPFSNLNMISQWFIYRKAKQQGIKVLLNGQGADETLTGYYESLYYFLAGLLKKARFSDYLGEIVKINRNYNFSKGFLVLRSLQTIASADTPAGLKRFLRLFKKETPWISKDILMEDELDYSEIRRLSASDFLNWHLLEGLTISPIPALLHFDDRNSMAFSIESRVPFFDYRMVEYLYSLPGRLKVKDGYTKYILRESMKGILPEKVRLRTNKKGFQSAAEYWFRNDLKDFVLEIINSDSFKSRPYFNAGEVHKEFKRYCDFKSNNFHVVVSWICLELWLRDFFDNPDFITRPRQYLSAEKIKVS